MKIRSHFRVMKERQPKKKQGLHVVNLPPEVADIYAQIHKPRFTGQKVSIRCPYCRTLNTEPMPMCCNQFREALILIRDSTPVPVMVN